MKTLLYVFGLGLAALSFNSCSSTDACADVSCANGTCVDGSCECDKGYKGANCDQEISISEIHVTKMTIKKFPQTDSGKAWDDEDDGSGPDVTMKVTDLQTKYFEMTDANTQLFENATSGTPYTIKCDFKIRNFKTNVTFEVLDYDTDKNFYVTFEFMSSVSTNMQKAAAGFPDVISLVSASGSTQIDLTVSYTYN
ncbi:hypothetical protein GC194_10310 [bacterium]|nr:hypothetical protein [bacterium]